MILALLLVLQTPVPLQDRIDRLYEDCRTADLKALKKLIARHKHDRSVVPEYRVRVQRSFFACSESTGDNTGRRARTIGRPKVTSTCPLSKESKSSESWPVVSLSGVLLAYSQSA